MVCLLQLLLFSSIMAKAMVALVVLAASFLMFSALGMNRAMVPAGGGGGGGGGPNMMMVAGAAAAMYQATSPPLPPIADEGNLRCSHGKSADEDCAMCSSISVRLGDLKKGGERGGNKKRNSDPEAAWECFLSTVYRGAPKIFSRPRADASGGERAWLRQPPVNQSAK